MRIIFEIEKLPELESGIRGFYDQVTIEIESGDPGGEDGQFESYMKQVFVEWYDGAKVTEL